MCEDMQHLVCDGGSFMATVIQKQSDVCSSRNQPVGLLCTVWASWIIPAFKNTLSVSHLSKYTKAFRNACYVP